jgi:glycosyltransferase involved in cell wall biosynthesis
VLTNMDADRGSRTPRFSVVICTYNRASTLAGAMKSVLDQEGDNFELVVVDDGSTDDTGAQVASFADRRVSYVRRANGGLSAARNTGAEFASGDYLAFLDDDDRFLPGWLAPVTSAVVDEGCTVVSWAAECVDTDGRPLPPLLPCPLGDAFEGYDGLIQAGTFAVTRDAYFAAGGFTEGLTANHQTDFALRLFPLCRANGWKVGVIHHALVRIVLARPQDRPRNQPDRLMASAVHLIDNYEAQLERSPETLADYLAIAGVSAARARRYAEARPYLVRAFKVSKDPRRKCRHAVRVVVASVPPVARRVWRSDAIR